MLRPIAARRPASLYQHLMECVDEQQLEVKGGRATVLRKTLRGSGELGRSSQTKATVLLESLCNVFWCIHAAQPRKMAVATVVQLQELLPLEGTVHALVDIVHAIMSTDPEMIPLGNMQLIKIAFSENSSCYFGESARMIIVLAR